MSATLDGNVGLTGCAPINLVVRFFTPDTEIEVFKACAPTDADGDFTIYGIPPGTYDVGIKADTTLSELVEDEVFTEGDTTEINFGNLRFGDLNGDDIANAIDQGLLYNCWNQGGDCLGYGGNWLMPACPSPPPAGGACYGFVIS